MGVYLYQQNKIDMTNLTKTAAQTVRFYHVVFDANREVKEQEISKLNTRKLSMECLAKVVKGTYEVIEQKY